MGVDPLLRAAVELLEQRLWACDRDPDARLGPVFERFFDVAETPGFGRLGEHHLDREVAGVLGRAAERAPGGPYTPVTGWMMVRVPELELLHGIFTAGDRLVVYFWFARTQHGLLALWEPDGKSLLVRVRPIPLAPGPEGEQ